MRNRDSYYLRKALILAGQSRERMRHGAIVVRNGKVLGSAVNIRKNSPTIPGVPLQACSIHAEVRALRLAGFPRRADVYVARAGAGGEARCSQPCVACATVLEEYKSRVVFT